MYKTVELQRECLCFRYTDSTISFLLKFQASGLLLLLYRPICVAPSRNSQDRFSRVGAQSSLGLKNCKKNVSYKSETSFRGLYPA